MSIEREDKLRDDYCLCAWEVGDHLLLRGWTGYDAKFGDVLSWHLSQYIATHRVVSLSVTGDGLGAVSKYHIVMVPR